MDCDGRAKCARRTDQTAGVKRGNSRNRAFRRGCRARNAFAVRQSRSSMPRSHTLRRAKRSRGHGVYRIESGRVIWGTVEKELGKARKRVGTRFPDRLNWLTSSLLGTNAFEDAACSKLSPDVAQLPYQLLTAIAGTLLEADCQKAAKAVFVVHEFRTPATLDSKLDFNAVTLNAFIDRFLSANSRRTGVFEFETSKIVGPILVNEQPTASAIKIPGHIPLFVGKSGQTLPSALRSVRTNLRKPACVTSKHASRKIASGLLTLHPIRFQFAFGDANKKR